MIWEGSSNLRLKESREDDADILIDFARGNHHDGFDFTGAGGSLGKSIVSGNQDAFNIFSSTAHAFYPGTGLGGDVHMDEDESWDIESNVGGDVSFFYTLLHELGHSFGLKHSSSRDSIMYPWYSQSRTERKLYNDDKWGIQQLYGVKGGGKEWGPNEPYNPPREITTTSTTTSRPRTSPRTRRPTAPTNEPSEKPDKCNTSFDAIGFIRNEVMVFKGAYMWRFRDGRLLQGYPTEFVRMWPELAAFDHIDAVFERKDGKFAFFSGQDVVVINGHTKTYTHDLVYLGLKRKVKKIDAIFTWGRNNQTYMFSGNEYWK